MRYIHPYKKVLTWDKFRNDICNKRAVTNICKIMPDSSPTKTCLCDIRTRNICPIWNSLEPLMVNNNSQQRRGGNYVREERERKISPVKERGFRED